jgi:hypothetical protein
VFHHVIFLVFHTPFFSIFFFFTFPFVSLLFIVCLLYIHLSAKESLFFFNLCGGTLGTAATSGLLYQPRMIGEGDCGEIGGMKIGRGNRSTRRKPAPAPICQKRCFSFSLRDSAVGIATGYGLNDSAVGVRVPVEPRIITSPCRPDRL